MNERNEDFDEFLDEYYPQHEIFGMTFTTSQILFNCDPIAYHVILSDWEDQIKAYLEEKE